MSEQEAASVDTQRIRAALRLIGDSDITPGGRRVLESICDEAEGIEQQERPPGRPSAQVSAGWCDEHDNPIIQPSGHCIEGLGCGSSGSGRTDET